MSLMEKVIHPQGWGIDTTSARIFFGFISRAISKFNPIALQEVVSSSDSFTSVAKVSKMSAFELEVVKEELSLDVES